MTDEPVTLPPAIAITAAPRTLAIGTPWSIDVSVAGDVADSELVVTLRSPGIATPGVDDTRFVMTGALIPVGTPQWLAPDGSWSTTDVAVDPAPAAGPRTLSLVLPAATAGEWRATIALRSAAGTLWSVASATALVTDTPAIRVALDRRWAGEADIVSATARVAVAGRSDVQLIAWLTLPDGSQLALPEMSPTYRVVPRNVDDEDFTLLGRDLVAYGPGDYRIAARLVDGDGNLLAAGGGSFTVCTANGTLDGALVDDAGIPIGLDGESSIAMMSLDRRTSAVRLPVAADGTFHAVDLPVGTWAISGRAIDASGARSLTPQVFEVGCAGPTAIQVVAGAAVGPPMRRPRAIAPVIARGAEVPKVQLRGVVHNVPPVNPDEAELVGTRVATNLFNSFTSRINVLEDHDLRALLAHASNIQGIGGSDMRIDDIIGSLLGDFDFIMLTTTVREGSRYATTVSIAAPNAILMGSRRVNGATYDALLAALDAAMPSFAAEVEAKMHQHLGNGPRTPVLTTTISPESPVKGQPIRITVQLKDLDTCIPAPLGTRVTLDYNLSPTVRGTADLAVDANGMAVFEQTVPDDGQRAIVLPHYVDEKGATTNGLSNVALYRQSSNVELLLDKVKVSPFNRVKAALRALQPGGVLPVAPHAAAGEPAMFVTFGVYPLVGIAPPTVMTDHEGKASFDWIVGARGGMLTVAVSAADVGVDTSGVLVEPPFMLDVEVFPTDVALTNTPLDIRTLVILDNAVPGVGVPVKSTIISGNGAGALNATDETGRATLPFTTPALQGETEIKVSATYDGAVVTKTFTITARAPCSPNCPPLVVTTDDADGAVDKGGTIRFFANQDVSWSATGGSISAGGVLTAYNDGGVWTVTAASTESPGSFGTRDYIVNCDDYDMIGTYPAALDIEVFDPDMSCATAGMSTGMVEIMQHAFPLDPKTADFEIELTPTCTGLFGVGEIQFMPRIDRCTLSQSVTVNGCTVAQFAASAVGPGVSGLTGSFTTRHVDLATTACNPVHSVFYEPPP